MIESDTAMTNVRSIKSFRLVTCPLMSYPIQDYRRKWDLSFGVGCHEFETEKLLPGEIA